MGRTTPAVKRLDDGDSIADDEILYRVLAEESWSTLEAGVRRVSSHAFKDTLTYETSCFLGSEKPVELLRRMFPGKHICQITAGIARQAGFVVARAPEECNGDQSHVVLCPPSGLPRKQADRLWAELSFAATVVNDN